MEVKDPLVAQPFVIPDDLSKVSLRTIYLPFLNHQNVSIRIPFVELGRMISTEAVEKVFS